LAARLEPVRPAWEGACTGGGGAFRFDPPKPGVASRVSLRIIINPAAQVQHNRAAASASTATTDGPINPITQLIQVNAAIRRSVQVLIVTNGGRDRTPCKECRSLMPEHHRNGLISGPGFPVAAKRLLIIDDEAGVGKAVGLVATQVGIDCKAIDNPATACETFRDYCPDIVLLDMIMPGKDGVEVLSEILRTGIPARIMLTAGFGESYLRLAVGVARFHGIDQVSVLKKPFRRRDLVELLTGAAAEY
jgi:CheY-like chemotaxis protein